VKRLKYTALLLRVALSDAQLRIRRCPCSAGCRQSPHVGARHTLVEDCPTQHLGCLANIPTAVRVTGFGAGVVGSRHCKPRSLLGDIGTIEFCGNQRRAADVPTN
jgi:hypothetical protein